MRRWCFILMVVTMSSMASETLLIDDFRDDNARSALGTRWDAFTDRVMGGVSDMRADVVEGEDGPALRLEGEVRLENNGGFIQARLPLAGSARGLDASSYESIRLRVRGTPGSYFIHLRTPDCRRPWQYYRAPLPVSEDWRDVSIRLDSFEPKSLSAPLDTERLNSLGVVAAGEAFRARIEVSRIELLGSGRAGNAGSGTAAGH